MFTIIFEKIALILLFIYMCSSYRVHKDIKIMYIHIKSEIII